MLVARLPEFDAEITRADAYPETIESIFGDIRLRYGQIVSEGTTREVASDQGTQLDLFNRTQTARQIMRLLGIDVFALTPELTTEISAFTVDNVALIESIPERYLKQVKNTALRNLRAGNRFETWKGELPALYKKAQSSAALIARDQTNKFNGELNAARQTSLGIDSYRWKHSGDERVRGNPDGSYPDAYPSHWERGQADGGRGQLYKWSNPPEGGHPGHPIQCRCQAEPDVEATLERLGV